ncbi:hypothetical protein EYR36_008034 [Pleurotus pulmonarius]|nr:hypothetical protein EYR36_008034 [Pleurotus pulmonarius]
MKSTASKLKEGDKSYIKEPPSCTAHGTYSLQQRRKSHFERLIRVCRLASAQGISPRVVEGKEFTKDARDDRRLTRMKSKFLAALTCGCGKDVIGDDELIRATIPADGDPNISLPWNFQTSDGELQHNAHFDPANSCNPIDWAIHIDVQSYQNEAQLAMESDYALFKQEPPIVALKRLRSWGIRTHLDETHLRHLDQVIQAGATAHRRRLEPSNSTATDDPSQVLYLSPFEVEVYEEEPPAYSVSGRP